MSLDPARRAVLVDVAFEIGGVGLAGFPKMLSAMRYGNYATAAVELRNSRLFSQVPTREQENLMILATGQWPSGISTAAQLVEKHEGCVLTAEPDAKGKWVIGRGHDIDAPTGLAPTCTQAEADVWFEHDLDLATQRAKADLGAEYWGDGT